MREWSPRARARLSGLFELFEGTLSVYGQMVVPGMLVVARDAAATANAILANEALYRFGIAAGLVAVGFHLAWGFALHGLLRIVDRAVARFAVLVLVVNSAIQAVAAVLLFGPLAVLRNTDPLSAFDASQLQALALVFLRLNAQAYDVFLAFFGVWLVAIGYLVFRSTFMPRLIGVGLMLEGLGWCAYVSPPVGQAIFPVTAALGLVGELPLLIWMLVRGVDSDRWREHAARAASPSAL